MIRGPLGADGFSPRFSGHETFPFRYGWLTKYVAFIRSQEGNLGSDNNSLAHSMIELGVGKNMVSSMRYWALATGICEPDSSFGIKVSEFGRWLVEDFGDRRRGGLDPYLEYPATIWALHWRLAGPAAVESDSPRSVTGFWAFNHFSSSTFTRESMVSDLEALVRDQQWKVKSRDTLKRDVDCFIRSYVAGRNARGEMIEDSLECPLSELGLIRLVTGGRAYEFSTGEKSSLPDSVFAFAVAEFVDSCKGGAATSLDALTYDIGSPGRVFRLGESAISERLARIEETSLGLFAWIDTAGVRQIQKTDQAVTPLAILKQAYRETNSREAA